MKNVLLIGCSNLLDMHHAFRKVFQKKQSDVKITQIGTYGKSLVDNFAKYTNLCHPGAGNSYIRWRLFDVLEHEHPDYVYLQFSGLVRRDFYFDIDAKEDIDITSDRGDITLSDKHIYMIGGNYKRIKNPKKFEFVLRNLSYNFWDDNTNNWHSLQEIFCAISVLEKLGIKYNWTVYYDPTDPPTQQTELEGKIDKWPEFINLKNKLPYPLNHAVNNGNEIPDGVHFGYDAFVSYLEHHKSKIHLDFDDK